MTRLLEGGEKGGEKGQEEEQETLGMEEGTKGREIIIP